MIKPHGQRLVVRPLTDEEQKTESGIIPFRSSPLVDAATRSVVVSVGDTTEFDVGQIVIHGPMAGDTIRVFEGGKFMDQRILRTDSILASIV